jgi:RNA polymerase sigma-70 factor (ECF subfamily)
LRGRSPRSNTGAPQDFASALSSSPKAGERKINGRASTELPEQAEEAAQEVFLRVHRSLAEFRGEAKLSTWLFAITSRLCLSRLASGAARIGRARDSESALATLACPDGGAPEALERREAEAAVHQAIAELPEDQRIVVVLRDLEGLAYEEIAESLGLTLGTVRSRLHRARLELKARLEKVLT